MILLTRNDSCKKLRHSLMAFVPVPWNFVETWAESPGIIVINPSFLLTKDEKELL